MACGFYDPNMIEYDWPLSGPEPLQNSFTAIFAALFQLDLPSALKVLASGQQC